MAALYDAYAGYAKPKMWLSVGRERRRRREENASERCCVAKKVKALGVS